MSYPVIVEEHRGGKVENIHQGIICVVNDKKEVIYEKGNIESHVYYRSAMKPIQAIPIFLTNIIEKYQLTKQEAALFTASQRGEKYHQEALESLMEKLGLSEELLICGESYPLNDEPKEQYIWDHKPKENYYIIVRVNILGSSLMQKKKGLDLASYDDPNHPLQQEILAQLVNLSETPVDQINKGVDGCGAPVYGVPLKNMAISYLKFVAPELIEDKKTAQAVTKIGEVMNAHPEIVASHNFICSVLLEDDNIIAKGGAQGVYCLSLKKERISIALKVLSGSELVWPVLVAEILEKLNYSNRATIENLLAIRPKAIMNDNGKPIGETKVNL